MKRIAALALVTLLAPACASAKMPFTAAKVAQVAICTAGERAVDVERNRRRGGITMERFSEMPNGTWMNADGEVATRGRLRSIVAALRQCAIMGSFAEQNGASNREEVAGLAEAVSDLAAVLAAMQSELAEMSSEMDGMHEHMEALDELSHPPGTFYASAMMQRIQALEAQDGGVQ